MDTTSAVTDGNGLIFHYRAGLYQSNLDAAQNTPQFGTDERAAAVRSVDVKPNRLAITDESDLFQVVERADGCCAECRAHLKNQTRHRLFQL